MKKFSLVFVIIALLGVACSSLKVSSQYDQKVNFKDYKTYSYLGWSNNSDELLNSFDKRTIESAFNKEFSSRGMKYVESGGDIEISLFIVTDTKTATTAYTDYYSGLGAPGVRPYRYGAWGWGAGYATTTYHQYDYKVGTLICDVFDHSSQQLIWQGVGSGTIEENPSNRSKKIEGAVKKIMSLYPLAPTK